MELKFPTPAASAPGLTGPGGANQPRQTAVEFEALLIGQLLESARQPGGWLGGDDEASQTMTGFAEQQLAAVMAQAGGLGLSAMLESTLGAEGQGQVSAAGSATADSAGPAATGASAPASATRLP